MVSLLDRSKRNLTFQWLDRIVEVLGCLIADLFDVPDTGKPYLEHIEATDDDSYLFGQLNSARDQAVAEKMVIAMHPILDINKLLGL